VNRGTQTRTKQQHAIPAGPAEPESRAPKRQRTPGRSRGTDVKHPWAKSPAAVMPDVKVIHVCSCSAGGAVQCVMEMKVIVCSLVNLLSAEPRKHTKEARRRGVGNGQASGAEQPGQSWHRDGKRQCKAAGAESAGRPEADVLCVRVRCMFRGESCVFQNASTQAPGIFLRSVAFLPRLVTR
jgi:hypothetical protein